VGERKDITQRHKEYKDHKGKRFLCQALGVSPYIYVQTCVFALLSRKKFLFFFVK